MLEDTPGSEPTTDPAAGSPTADVPAKQAAAKQAPAKKAAAKKAPAKKAAAKKAPAKKAAAAPAAEPAPEAPADAPAKKAPAKKVAAKKAPAKKAAAKKAAAEADGDAAGTVPLFQAPDAAAAPARKRPAKKTAPTAESTPDAASDRADAPETADRDDAESGDSDSDEGGEGGARRRRRRGGRRRRKSGGEGDGSGDGQGDSDSADDDSDDQDQRPAPAKKQGQGGGRGGGQGGGRGGGQGRQQGRSDADEGDADGESSTTRRRRRRRRAGEDGPEGEDDPQNTVTKVRKTRSPDEGITALSGSTRLEAKKQRRREGREAGRRRAPIVSEAEFLARRESVDRVMAIRQRDDLTQIAVLEDKVLVEHYVARESQTSLIGNVYLGRVQNVLPSMEAAFIDIGKGRNAVLYAGEVNWSSLGHKDGQPRKIESVLSSGQSVLVQVTKDPVGHKGARLTSQVSLAGRFLVYVPDNTNSGISRKLPDTERSRLKALLKEIVPDGAGVIVRTAAEGASEEELTRDVERLTARWDDIEKKAKGSAPQLLYGEPDLMLKVVRDLFTEDFAKLVVQGGDAYDTVHDYVTHVAPDLIERLEQHDPSKADLFTTYRIEEQIHKGLDRKVWLPSGGSLVIDRTEAMTVVDVNTGKFTGSGGNLEETVTKNNLEAAEEIVRQLRLRDIGGIIVVDFIDMVLESNRDLVLRRLVECLGRDRTRHQVAEVTSLGLVQMTRKRIGTGLLEAFSEPCEHCAGRGVIVADVPIEPKKETEARRSRRSRGGKGKDDPDSNGGSNGGSNGQSGSSPGTPPSPKDVAAMARTHKDDDADRSDQAGSDQPAEPAEDTSPDQPGQDEQQDEQQQTRPWPTRLARSSWRRRSPSRPPRSPLPRSPLPRSPLPRSPLPRSPVPRSSPTSRCRPPPRWSPGPAVAARAGRRGRPAAPRRRSRRCRTPSRQVSSASPPATGPSNPARPTPSWATARWSSTSP